METVISHKHVSLRFSHFSVLTPQRLVLLTEQEAPLSSRSLRLFGDIAQQKGTGAAAQMDCRDGAGEDRSERIPVADLREHILQLSGYSCHEDEEKSRTELLEKLNKCKRDTLIALCRSIDITGSRANRKEELVSFLMKFSKGHSSGIDGRNPDKKVKKRRHVKEDANLSSDNPLKKRKREDTGPETLGEKDADEVKGVQDRENYSECVFKDNRYVHDDNKKGKFQNEEANLQASERISGSMPENLNGPTLGDASIRKNEQEKASKKKISSFTKKIGTPKEDRKIKACGKQESRGDSKLRKQALKPTRDELREAIFLILDSADFATMTFGEVVKKVDKYFGKDLFERKPLIRSLIEEELFRLAEEAEKKELEEEEAAEAKARADQAAMERAKDKTVESGMNKPNELQVDQHSNTNNTANNKSGSTIEKGAKLGTAVEAADNRNSSAAAGSPQDGKTYADTKNEHNGDELTKDGKGEKVAPDDCDDADQGSGKAETVKNKNVDILQVSKDGKPEVVSKGENDDTGVGGADKGRGGSGGNYTADVSGCEAEKSNGHADDEHIERAEDSKAHEANNNGNSKDSKAHEANNNGNSKIVAIPSDKDGKAKEGDTNPEQCPTDSGGNGKGKADDADANAKADADSSKNGTTENGKNDDDVKANSDSVA
ncbi:hypothetical protein ACP70R_014356 [Stipagrostis hirtigluma subsp. patula]